MATINIPYESNALKQTHPSHLYALAKAHGLAPTLPEKARVLEIACASGGNLIPMAFYYPQAYFLGIDIAQNEIALAKTMCEELALSNIQFKAQNILEYNENDKFDYIICHGLFSWVEEELREKTLRICQQALSENGIAYISYNTYPGWNVGNALRDMMLYAAKEKQSVQDKLTQVHALLQTLSHSLSNATPYESLLKQEVNVVLRHSDTQLLHEHLSSSHYPFYFYQFYENALQFDLHYVCDATFNEFQNNLFDVKSSQLLDLMENRRFRSSLLSKTKSTLTASMSLINQAYSSLSPNINSLQVVPHLPLASPLARYQATHQEHVTNRFHENILLSPIAQALMPYLNGQLDARELTQIVLNYIDAGDLILLDNQANQIRDDEEMRKKVAQIYHETMLLLYSRHLIS